MGQSGWGLNSCQRPPTELLSQKSITQVLHTSAQPEGSTYAWPFRKHGSKNTGWDFRRDSICIAEVSTSVPGASQSYKGSQLHRASSAIGQCILGSGAFPVDRLISHPLFSVPFRSSPSKTRLPLTCLLEVLHGSFVTQQEVRWWWWCWRWTIWPLHLFLCTV